jgi:hypothetical protein
MVDAALSVAGAETKSTGAKRNWRALVVSR